MPSLWCHLVLARLLTANWLRHFVALLLVLNPVLDSGLLLPESEKIIQEKLKRASYIHMVAAALGQTCIPDGVYPQARKLSSALDGF